MTLSIPIIILIALSMLGTGTELARHGKPQTGNHNIFIVLASQGILWGILFWAGLFN